MRWRGRLVFAAAAALLAGTASCGAPSEAPRVQLPVLVDASGLASVTTDLGYVVDVRSVRIAINDIVFTVAGDAHAASPWRALRDLVIPPAYAHPGHYQGGEVTGELRGEFVVDWPSEDGRELGFATLIAATYSASNFTFGRGSAEALGADDPLVGHSAVLAGSATKEGERIDFTLVVDSPEGRELVGAPFEARLGADATGTLNFRFNTTDGLEGDTVFDALDFATLDADGDGVLMVAPGVAKVADAYNTFRRVFQTHDHYSFELRE